MSRTFIKRSRTLLALAAGVVVTLQCAQAGGGGITVGTSFPSLNQFQLEGRLPESMEGRIVVLDFWASWCLPCKESFPALNDLHRRFASRGVIVIGVNVDEQRAAMDRFLKKHPAAFSVVRDAQQKLVAAVNAEAMPTTVILDGKGQVRFVHRGFHGDETRRAYEKEIGELLEEFAAR